MIGLWIWSGETNVHIGTSSRSHTDDLWHWQWRANPLDITLTEELPVFGVFIIGMGSSGIVELAEVTTTTFSPEELHSVVAGLHVGHGAA